MTKDVKVLIQSRMRLWLVVAIGLLFPVFAIAQSGSGNALDMTSTTDYPQRTNSSLSTLNYPFTITCWVKLNANATQTVWPIFASSYIGTGYSGIRFSYRSSGDFHVSMGNNNGYTSFGRRTIIANAPGIFGEWVHIAVSVTGPTTADVYLNGSPRPITTSGTGPNNFHRPPNGTSTIGFIDAQLEDHFMNGEIDELSIWSKALTQTEVRTNMCQRLTGNEPDLEAYYRFDGTGTTISDITNNNQDFTYPTNPNISRSLSAAPVGDVSQYTYQVGTVSFTAPNGVTLSCNNNTGGGNDGVHIYFNYTFPDQQQGLGSLCDSTGHFGRFIATNPAQPNIPGQVSVSPTMSAVFTRPSSNVGTWTTAPLSSNLFYSDIFREFIFDPAQFLLSNIDRIPVCDSATITAPYVFNGQYTWDNGLTGRTINTPPPGTHWVTISSSCATFTDTFEVYRDTLPDPVALIDTTTICPGDTGTLVVYNITSRPPIDTVVWSDGLTGVSRPVWNTGWYYAWVGVSGSCWRYDSVYVDYGDGSYYLGPDTTLCNGEQMQLSVPSSATNIQWSDGSSGTSLTVSSAGTYYVSFEQNGCSSTDTIEVDVINFSISIPSALSICNGQSSNVNINASANPDSVYWSTGEGTNSIQVSTGGTIWVEAYFGGCVDSDTVVVTLLSGVSNVPQQEVVFCSGESATLSLSGIVPSQYISQVTWSTGQTANTITVNQGGLYTANGVSPCGTFSVDFLVDEVNCNVLLFLPTAFSPNGDGTNDLWEYQLSGLQEFRMEVYDRWGNRVYLQNSSTDPYWDGTFQGRRVQMGTYVYQLVGRTYRGEVVERAGHISILK